MLVPDGSGGVEAGPGELRDTSLANNMAETVVGVRYTVSYCVSDK